MKESNIYGILDLYKLFSEPWSTQIVMKHDYALFLFELETYFDFNLVWKFFVRSFIGFRILRMPSRLMELMTMCV